MTFETRVFSLVGNMCVLVYCVWVSCLYSAGAVRVFYNDAGYWLQMAGAKAAAASRQESVSEIV